MQDAINWEGVALDVGDETGCNEPPVSGFDLVGCFGFALEAWRRPGAVLVERDNVIKFNPTDPIERQHRDVTHELSHHVLRRARLPDEETGARYVAGALLMPRRVLDADIRSMAWSVVRLRERHRFVSEIALAVRITQLRDAVMTVVDPMGRKSAWRRWSPWLESVPRRPSRFERELAAQAWDLRRQVHADSLCYAVPVVDVDGAGEDRVVVVCEFNQLSLRLAESDRA